MLKMMANRMVKRMVKKVGLMLLAGPFWILMGAGLLIVAGPASMKILKQ